MAGRTSTSFGMGVAVTVLSLTTVGFFVAFAVYFGKNSDNTRALQVANDASKEILRDNERNRDDIRSLVQDAKKNGDQSLVQYLLDSQAQTMQLVTGSRRGTAADLAARMDSAGIKNTTLMARLNDRAAEISNLQAQLEQAKAAQQKAMADLSNEVDRVARLREDHQRTIDSMQTQIGQMASDIDGYRVGTDEYKKQLDAQRERQLTEAAERQKTLQDQLAKANEEVLVVKGQLADLRKQKSGELFRADDESALVDATILSTNPAERQAFISIGTNQRVVLGMTFNVYSNKSAIRPDKDGNYPTGKAVLEVVRAGDTSSTCRIVSEVRGNPVVRGDVVANPLFDPNKSYKFVVFGNFDTNRDGSATSMERQDITSMIQAWGGRVSDDLAGDTDFLVLGERPVVPPRPPADVPLEVIQEFIRRQRDVERYDTLYNRASSTSVPIISENRLYTLVGKTPSRLR